MFKILDDNGEIANVDSLGINSEDLIVIKMRGSMPTKNIKEMTDQVKNISGGNRVLVLPDGYEIGVLKQEKDILASDIIDNRKVLMEDVD